MISKQTIQESVTKLNCALELGRQIVGVKLLFSEEEFEAADAKRVSEPMNYCVLVKLAGNGYAFKAKGTDLACIAGARALGLTPMDDWQRSGQNGRNLGIYDNMSVAKSVRDRMYYCEHAAVGVVVRPLADFQDEPDLALIITSPYNVMRLMQGYSYHYGMHSSYQMVGNQAICSEASAMPYLTNDINVSMLCIGTRHRAGWSDQELAVGLPISRLETMTDGVMSTINIMDSDEKKRVIAQKLQSAGLAEPAIRYHCNYWQPKK